MGDNNSTVNSLPAATTAGAGAGLAAAISDATELITYGMNASTVTTSTAPHAIATGHDGSGPALMNAVSHAMTKAVVMKKSSHCTNVASVTNSRSYASTTLAAIRRQARLLSQT